MKYPIVKQYYNLLTERAKTEKEPERSRKKCNRKKRRIDQTSQPPFYAGPSRWYGNRGGRQSTWMSKQDRTNVRVTENLSSETTRFQRNQDR